VAFGHLLWRYARGGGRVVRASSPQGRFAEAAALLDDTRLVDAQAWGKQLFVEFEGDRFVQIHLGLIGSFRFGEGEAPPPVGQVRLRLVVDGDRASYGDLRGATTCALVTAEQRRSVVDRLGPDPLRADADWAKAWARVSRSRKPIGALLMDQQVLAGVGNVYRAELLFRHRVHPLRPGNTLRRGQFEAMWGDLVALMQEGVLSGRIDHRPPGAHPGRDGSTAPRGRPRGRGLRLSPARTALPRLRRPRPDRGARGAQPVLVPALPADVPLACPHVTSPSLRNVRGSLVGALRSSVWSLPPTRTA
jgi:endonuclease-8